MKKFLTIFILSTLAISCQNDINARQEFPKTAEETRIEKMGKITGDEGISLSGRKRRSESVGITVNSYLWRAALEAISDIPIQVVDPFSGVITTEWYKADSGDNERFKLNIIIMSDMLRADAIKVSVFTQKYLDGNWKDAESNKVLALEIEDRILTRARQLKIASE